ncbi:SRPBCC family protein [Streptomyces sp. NPDC059740]|uniref:SRPBCC family protein n=1 Tax=Streptomyces sp. NPDC059740 TaxID=3346926 RepID=UPI003665D13C
MSHRPALHRYCFDARWPLAAPPAVVYRELERVEDYPGWWPQVRRAERSEAGGGVLHIRSFLPYELVVELVERRRDPGAGVLEAALTGDMVGEARWRIEARGQGTVAVYHQEVSVTRPLLRWLALPGRPLFSLNHAAMMRAGHRGLARRLAGG